MLKTQSLQQAKRAKKDEFYTRLADIETEMNHYKQYFAGKTVYCNCDDPRVSNFFHYFSYGFDHLKLKKVLATCYKNQNPDMLSDNEAEKAIYIEYKRNGNGELIPYPDYMELISESALYANIDNPNIPQPEDIGIGYLKGDGDFRSDECIDLLQQADVVVTNPPFSLFREYVEQLVKYDKKFLIIGNLNAVTYKEVFKLFKENKIWFGVSISSGDREFGIPDDYPLTAATHRVDDEGNKFVRVKGVRWFTNIEHTKRNEELILYQKYTPEEYPKYDNYDAINVDKTTDIPADYSGAMGVPISFLDKYNPEQFEILGSDYEIKDGLLPELVRPGWTGKVDRGYLGGKRLYSRILIKNKKLLR